MSFEYIKTAIVAAWILIWAIMAVSLGVSSASSWALVVGSAVLPPLMLLRLWQPPAQTISETIREVTR